MVAALPILLRGYAELVRNDKALPGETVAGLADQPLRALRDAGASASYGVISHHNCLSFFDTK